MPLNPNAMVTIELARTHLSMPLPLTASQQTLLEVYINSASARVETYLDRKIIAQTFTHYFEAKTPDSIIPREYPIIEIDSLQQDTSGRFLGEEEEVDADNYSISDGRAAVEFIDWHPTRVRRVKSLELTYRAGYELADLPGDIQLGCLWLIEWMQRSQAAQDIGRTSKAKGDEQVSLETGFPARIKQILDPYKRIEFVDYDSL